MKQIFALLSVFALLLCMAMPTTAKASDSGYAIDVGYNVEQHSPEMAKNLAHSYTCDFLPSPHFAPMPANFANAVTPTVTGAAMREKTYISKYWRGGDTKASLCKACSFSSKQHRTAFVATPYAFGRDIRRLCSEAK